MVVVLILLMYFVSIFVYYREVKGRNKKAAGAQHARAAGAAIPKHQPGAHNARGGTTR